MFFSDIETLKKDLHWLCKECTLEHFTEFRLSSFEYDTFNNKIERKPTNNFVMNLFEDVLDKFNLQDRLWQTSINNTMLPMLALIPDEGLKVILELNSDGSYLTTGSSGGKVYGEFPSKTRFRILKFKRSKVQNGTAKQMFLEIAKKQKRYLFYGIIASLSVNVLALGSSFYSMQVYDRVIPTNGMSTLIALTIGVAIAIFLEMILKLSRSSIMDQASKNMDIEYSHTIFERFLHVRADCMPKSIGTLSGQLQSYGNVRAFISTVAMFMFIDFPFSFIFFFVILLLGGMKIAIILLGFLVISLFIGVMFKSKIERLTKASSSAAHKKLGLLVESVENSEKIKSTGAKWSVLNKWNQLTEDAMDDEICIKHYTDISNYLATFSQQISYVAIISMGAYLISTTTTITMGSLIAISILSNKLFAPIAQLPSLFVQWGRAKISIEDLNTIYKLEKDNEGVEKPITHKLHSYDLRCEYLKFGYEENSEILNIPRLSINSGEKVAIIGGIGTGKSTLLKILAGLYKTKKGKVFLADLDIQQISRNTISETIGYLAQETKLISGTLRDNLCVGIVGVTDERILSAAKSTGLISLISALPKGLDTPVPEGGDNVSGGQKQLIALTRMLVANNNILLLDEPTASMDEGTEQQLIKVLKNTIKKEQTMVVVTHKPVLLNLVDRIIVVTTEGIVMDDTKKRVLQTLQQHNIEQKGNNDE